MNIGNDRMNILSYRTGTQVDIQNNSDLTVTGAFAKNAGGSAIDFAMTSGTTVRVNIDPDNTNHKTAFDISNTASSFTMDGGEIIVATGSASASADYNVNATLGGLMTAGTITSGDGSTATPSAIKFRGSMPIENFHVVGDGTANTNTQLVGNITIDNFWEIDQNNTFSFTGNTAELHGDINNAGTFDHTSGTLLINGTADQRITNLIDDKVHFYNLTMSKSSGDLVLTKGATGETNLAVHNTLNFAVGNVGVIKAFVDGAETNAFYVEVSPAGASVNRSGQGHVYGRLYRYVQAGVSADLEYPIGGPSYTDYRRTIFKAYGEADGTEGTVGIIHYDKKQYQVDLTGSIFQMDTDLEEYWNVNNNDINSGVTFTLGTEGTYELTTYFPSSSPSFTDIDEYEHFIYTPQCPDLPDGTACSGDPGDWDFTVMEDRGTDGSDVFLKSVDHDYFGDFVAAIPNGRDFWSIQDGAWDVSANWSNVGYGGAAVVDGAYPGSDNRKADNIYIGDDIEITIPSSFTPISLPNTERYYRSIRVENIGFGPGELYIEGSDESVFVNEFVLEDECLLGVQNRSGLRLFSDGGAAIRMRSNVVPTFGISRYMFYGTVNQETSQSIPDSVAALIVDNSGISSNNVSLTIFSGITEIGIRDYVLVNRGRLRAINRDFLLGGDFYLENNGEFNPNDRAVKVFEDKTHTFRLDNAAGLQLYDLVLDFDGGASNEYKLNIIRNDDAVEGIDDNTAHLYIENELTFDQAVIMDGRDDVRKVILQNGASSLVQNDTEDGWVDGYLGKYVAAGDNQSGIKFEIGYEEDPALSGDEDYDPVTVSFTSTASGIMEAIVNKDFTSYPADLLNNENYGHRMDPDHRVPRWWNIQGYAENTDDLGANDVNVLFEYPASFNSSLTGSPIPTDAVIRRHAIPSYTPLWTERGPSPEIDWTINPQRVTVNIASTATNWDGIGDFFIGDKYPRCFL